MKRIISTLYLFFCLTAVAYSQDLGDRIDLSNSKAAKGLKFSICPPSGWRVQEAKNPNVTVEFVNQINGDSFNITITHAPTFISKKEFIQIKDEAIKENENVLKQHYDIFLGCDTEIIKIDGYPFIKFTARGFVKLNTTGLTPCRIVMFIGWIEDLVLTLNGMEFNYATNNNRIPRLYERVATSLSLYEQYDYVNTGRP